MTTYIQNRRVAVFHGIALATCLAFCFHPTVVAAEAPVTPAALPSSAKPADDNVDVVHLNAFEVRADTDNSYGALDSNSITRFRTDLEKMPVTTEVFTETFMRDIAATSVEEMLTQYAGVGTGTADAGSAGSFNTQPGDAQGAQLFSRGLRLTVHRDGFIAATPMVNGVIGATDNFSVERAEVTRGANSLLYGDVGGGGVANIVSKQARFGHPFARADYRIDQLGAKRATFDFGTSVGNKIAVRVAAMGNVIKYNRINLGGETSGLYAQLAIRLPYHSIVRVWGQRSQAFITNSVNNGNVNNFFYQRDASGNYKLTLDATGKVVNAKDPSGADTGQPLLTLDTTDLRRNLNLRYLVATNQIADLGPRIFTPGLNLANVDSFRGWWKSDWNKDAYTGATLETEILPWLTSQVSVAYDDAVKDGPGGSSALTPAAGQPGSGNNPFAMTAISLNPSDTLTHTRIFGFRYSLLAENHFFGNRVHSQTLFGGEATNRNGGQSGVAYGYYLSDASGNIVVDSTKLTNKEYGRTLLANSPSLWFPVQNGLVAKPLFHPMTPVIQAINPATGQMAYWARQQRDIINLSLRTATNPIGVDQTGPQAQYNIGHTETHAYTVTNVTEWFNRVETFAGIRYILQTDTNYGPASSTISPPASKALYSAGLSYAVLPNLHVFSDVSTSFQPGPQPSDPYGVPRKSPDGGSPKPDLGVKFRVPKWGLNGSMTWYPQNTTKNEGIAIDAAYVTAINPNGINGQFSGGGSPNSQINADKRSGGVDLTIDYHPVRHWNMRLSVEEVDGTILTTSNFKQLYNDQFTVKSGVVTYGDGTTPIQINPTSGAVVAPGTAGSVPLTLAMINDPTSAVWANPDPDSGSIQSTALKNALKSTTFAVGGPSATSVTGLPISSIQYTFTDPNGHKGVMTPVIAGQKTTGYNHYSVALTNKYDFDRGRLKGFGIGNTIVGGYQFRSHYYPDYTQGGTTSTRIFDLQRKLWMRPTIVTADLILSYRHKLFGRYEWSTQLNVRNVFNHYQLLFPPQVSGNPPYNNFIYSTSPRQWIWTNSIAM
jgi:outer membrane receptor protein involved in Fe transport